MRGAAQLTLDTLERTKIITDGYMDRFEYVMVLISIIIGLSIAHVLFGIGRLIDRLTGGAIEVGRIHALWLGYVFMWTVQFWWWEFRFSELNPVWTQGLYLFLVTYSILLFLLSVILVPHSWDSVNDLDEFFLRRRIWFYWTLALATCADIVDGLLKGGQSYVIDDLGASVWILWLLSMAACVVGLRSKRRRLHLAAAAAVLFAQIVQMFVDTPTLGF